MIRRTFIFLCAAFLLVHPVMALDLDLPSNARRTTQENSKLDSFSPPFGPFVDGAMKTHSIEGEVRRSAWRIGSSGLTTLQVLAPLRAQLEAGGYTTALDCDQITCGGFDFRFAVEVLPAPDMYVNIRAYRFMSAYMGAAPAPSEVVTLLVSTSATAAYIQIIQAGDLDGNQVSIETQAAVPTSVPSAIQSTSLDSSLLRKGSVVLSDLDFATGTSDLSEGSFPVLQELAAFFKARDDIRLVLVGHTDSDGALDFNIALSKRRAASVRQRLLDEYGLDESRIFAEGNGYLSPLRTNLDAEGRKANRRVEAIVLPLN